ncbi:hypothetical protein MHYP_G00148650 [Metynnis hypsauchen]
MLSLTVGHLRLPFLIDTGATYSAINSQLPPGMMSSNYLSVRGFSGDSMTLPKTKPLVVSNGSQTLTHTFVIATQAPVNLCGRGLLMKMGASILCSPTGLTLTWPNGQITSCYGETSPSMYLLSATNDDMVDIYWGLVNDTTTGVLELFNQWRPWISMMEPYGPPPDPPHLTLYYDPSADLPYYDLFQSELQDAVWEVFSPGIYVGPEGVAAPITLTPAQSQWYKMSSSAAPHISLALHPGHMAKQLGGMTKRANVATNWVQTQISDVSFSETTKTYFIRGVTHNHITLTHDLLARHHGCEAADHNDTPILLSRLPDGLWSEGPDDVGQIKQTPVLFNMTSAQPIWLLQYRHKPEAMASLDQTIDALLKAGVLEPCQSGWNTPILPVPKKEPGQYRMAHDLRAINAALATQTIPVPNPYTALSELDHNKTWFTCIDLANAFFCVPVHETCRDICAFTHRGRQYRYTRLPQGFALSPGLFNQALKQSLDTCSLPEGSILIQYVDDLLIAGDTQQACIEASVAVLEKLAECGYKVSKQKLQFCRPRVTFLGRVVTKGSTGMSPQHRSSILSHAKPITVRDMLAFLGLVGYSRSYIPDFTGRTAPLREMVKSLGMRNLPGILTWTPELEQAFIELKQALAQAVDLARPDYTIPFYLDVSETPSLVNGVLFQKKGGGRQVLMYLSIPLDLAEKRQPSCTRHVAGLAKLVQKTAHIVAGHPLHVLTTHGVVAYINSQMFTLTPLRQRRIHKVLTAPNIIYTHDGINMADNMLEGPSHECAKKVEVEVKIRPDLKGTPIEGALNFWTDGCGYRGESGEIKAGFAVVQEVKGEEDEFWTVVSKEVKNGPSAQKAELLAVIAALELAEGREVNIYTDSAYAVGAAHIELPHWKETGYLTSTGKPVKHKEELLALERAIQLPKQVAIVKCKGHQKGNSLVERGNEAADKAAKKAAGYKEPSLQMILKEGEPREPLPTGERLRQVQDQASPEENSIWLEKGGRKGELVWEGPNGLPILPSSMTKAVLEEAHGLAHVGKAQMRENMKGWWHPFLTVTIATHIEECEVRSKGKSETDTPPEVAVSEWVYLKVIKRKWCEPRWTGPYRVVERTSHAVRLNGKGPVWYHLSQCRPAHPPKAEKESPLNGAE